MKPRLSRFLLRMLLPAFAASSLSLAATNDIGDWMAIGDSITHGTYSCSYRWFLQKTFIDNGIGFDAVGYHSGCYTTSYSSAGYGGHAYDNEHSAQFNIWTDEIAGTAYRRSTSVTGLGSANIKNWLGTSTDLTPDASGAIGTYSGETFSPDTYTIMLGTNDLNNLETASGKTSMDTMLANMGIIADTINANAQAHGKTATVYIMSVTATNRSSTLASNVSEYNQLLKEWTESYEGGNASLVYVDINRGLADVSRSDGYGVASMYASDKLHPTDQAALLIAGNMARAMGYAGRTAGQERKAASEFTVANYALGFSGSGIEKSGENISLSESGALVFTDGSSLSFSWDGIALDDGYTIDFGVTAGNGATDGWSDTDVFSVSISDGTHSGTLSISEAYIKWGDTILYSGDMSARALAPDGSAENLRIAYITGNSKEGLESGYYIWLGDMLIGEGLAADDASGALGVTLSYSGGGEAALYNFAMDNAAWAPTSTLYSNSDAGYKMTPVFHGADNGEAQGSVTDWSQANANAITTSIVTGKRVANSHLLANYANDSSNLGDCTVWNFSEAEVYTENNDSYKGKSSNEFYFAAYGLGSRTDDISVRLSGGHTGFKGVYGVWNGSNSTNCLTGNVVIQMDAANAVYGFVTGASGHSISGQIKIVLNSGSVTGDITGGVMDNESGISSSGQSIGSVALYINGGSVGGSVYGGSRVDNNAIAGAAAVTITGGSIAGSVYGGGTGGSIAGSASVTITGGSITGDVYGGGTGGSIAGSTSVTITGGTVYGNVNGGNESDAAPAGSVTIESSHAWIEGSITAGKVTFKDVVQTDASALADNQKSFDQYEGSITAGELALDGVTASEIKASINASSISAANGTDTALSRVSESLKSLSVDHSDLSILISTSSLTLDELKIAAGALAVSNGSATGSAVITVASRATFGSGSVLECGLALGGSPSAVSALALTDASADGSYTLNMSAPVEISGPLTLAAGGTLNLEGLESLKAGQSLALFTGAESLTLIDAEGVSTTYDSLLPGAIDAGDYFTNLDNGLYTFRFDNQTLSICMVPEPAAATLALLALAGLAARRRRK